jgi:hypothetical protein
MTAYLHPDKLIAVQQQLNKSRRVKPKPVTTPGQSTNLVEQMAAAMAANRKGPFTSLHGGLHGGY